MKTRKEPLGLFECTNCGKDLGIKGQSHLTNTEDGEQVWSCNKPQHTPTPWKLSSIDIRNAKNQIVALRPSAAPDKEINHRMFQDVAFIVRAVNSYEKNEEIKKELLEVLKAMHKRFITESTDVLNDTSDFELEKRSMSIIAKAEGKVSQ